MPENLVFIGFILLFIAIILIVIGSAEKGNIKFGFGGFIGPIPFGFANDPKLLWVVIIISAVLLFVFIVPFIKQFI